MKKNTYDNLHFMSGGGEMGQLIREKDWEKTPLGNPTTWPQSLRTIVSVMLDNPFGMYIAWGKEYTQIYNDGYRPILGATKHPDALGISSRETFSEIWHIIESMFDGVMEGVPMGFPDFMLPLNRNGYVEECYFDFSYSPIRKKNGKVGGVLVTVIETTDKKKTEESLKQTNDSFKAMADNIPNLAWMANKDGWIYWYNKKWYEYTATTPEQMEGWGWQKVHDPAILPNVMQEWQASIDRGNPFEMVFPLKGGDGKFRQFLTRILPLRNDEGEITQWFGTNTDVTVQKEIEDALMESKDQLEFAIEATELGTFDYNPLTNTFSANNRLKEWFGLPPNEEIQLPDAINVMAENDRERVTDAIQKALDYHSGGKYDIEYTIIHPHTQKETIVHAKGRAWFNDDKKAYRFNGTLQDISEKTTARRKIEASEQKFREAVEQAPVSISILRGENFVIEMANKMAQQLSGRSSNELIGKPIFEALPETEDQGFEPLLKEVYRTGIPFIGNELPLTLHRYGKTEEIFVNLMYEPLYNIEKEINGIINIGIDVTEQVLAKKKIEENERKLNLIIEASELGTWELDLITSAVSYSGKYLNIFGYDGHQILSHADLIKHLHPDDLEVRKKAFEAALKTGILEYQARLIWNDKSIHWMEGKGQITYDENQNPIKIMGTIRDITREKNHQIILEESEQKFRLLADSMPQHIWTADTDGNLNYYNKSVYDYSGFSSEKLNELGWLEIVHPDDREENIKVWEEAIKTGEDFLFEHRFRKHNGEYRWQLSRAIPQKDDDGKIQMWVGTSTDIQDQKTFTDELEEQIIRRTSELKESEEKFYNLFNLSPISKTLSDASSGKIVMVNDAFTNLFGYSREETIGKSSAELRLLDLEEREIIVNELETNGKVENRELWFINKSGERFIALTSSEIINIGDKQFFLSAINDISEIKKAEQNIKEKNIELEIKTNQLEEAQQLAHLGSWEWDVVANKIEWSDELYRIFGLTPQEFKADYENYLKYIHPDDREHVNSTVEEALKNHQPYSLFHKIKRADGKIRILSATGKVFSDDMGNVVRISGTVQDVTEQKNYEEELKISEERFYKIFDSNPVPMSLSEIGNSKIKYANSRFYNSFGYTKEEVIGRSSEELNLLDPEENIRVTNLIFEFLFENRPLAEVQALPKEEKEELLLRLNQSEKMKDFEILYTRKNGEKFPAIVSYEVIRLGDESYTVTSYQDITESKKAELLLRNQNDQLEKMNSELQSFAYVSSHDLQEPLRKIQLFTSRIAEKDFENLSPPGKEYFTKIQSSASRMQTLIQDLLTYSRTNTGDRKFEKKNLNDIIDDVKEELSDELKDNNAIIEVENLGTARVIEFQFRQLLHNLISNSLKFSKPNQVAKIKIESKIVNGETFNDIRFDSNKKYFNITFSDNGIGFPPQYNEKIFEMFQRLNTDYKGTGIGLSIVKKIVENHNGIITATSNLNMGATFEIYFPINWQ